MDRRIFGLETEYGVACTSGRHAPADPGRGRPLPVPAGRHLGSVVSNVFLRNGSRIYLDVGSHPEYATAECDDLVQLINHDRAGERILEDLIIDAEQRLASEGISGDIFLFKNNTDSHGNSYGCHENYLISRVGDFAKITDVLVPFLVSRQLICGSGKVLHTARGAEYSVSQRAEHIWESVSSATTRSRPIINTRDEPHADPERYRRLHVIVGDSNMSETTTLLKVGSAELVLRLIEAGVPMRDLTLENPIRAIRDLSRDPTGRVTVALSNGRRVSALELQSEYYEKVSEFVRREGLGTQRDRSGAGPVGADPAGRRGGQARPGRHRDRLGDQAEAAGPVRRQALPRAWPTRGSPSWISPTTTSAADAVSSTLLQARGLAARVTREPGDLPGQVGAAADHPGEAARRLHPGRPGGPQRLHRRLGAPQAQRPGPANRALQGPVPGGGRAGGPADRLDAAPVRVLIRRIRAAAEVRGPSSGPGKVLRCLLTDLCVPYVRAAP